MSATATEETRAENAGLTVRQWKLARFIAAYIREHSFPPSYREMQAAMGIRSTNGVKGHLAALEREGVIQRAEFTARGLKVLREV